MSRTFLLREVTGVRQDGDDLTVHVRGVRCFPLPDGLPGYLTGEPPAEQGIDFSVPNLPELDLPAVETHTYALRVTWAAPDTVRLTLGSEQATGRDPTWLGIVTTAHPEPAAVDVEERAEEVVATSDMVSVHIGRRPFSLSVRDTGTGRTLLRTAGNQRRVSGMPLAPDVLVDDRTVTLHLELGDEEVLGFGEQFGRVVKNGQHLVLRTEDALGTGTGRAYKPAPVWHSTAGCTGFLNTSAVVAADVGHSRQQVLGLDVDDDLLDLYVIAGRDPKERLTSYTALTGRPGVPPLWAFGFWIGRCRYHTRAEVEDVAYRMRECAVPCDVLHLDPDWLVVDRLNCDFVWNTERFGDRRDFVAALERMGLRLSVWEVPYLDPASPAHDHAEQKGYLVRDTAGALARLTGTPTPDGRPRSLVDVTNPDALAWWQGMHEEFLADGVAVFKTDFGEGLPDTAALADGTPANHAHNLYPLRYNAAVSDVTARHTGRAPLVWGRSGWAGSQRYPAQWVGDAEATVGGMRAALRGGLSHSVSVPGIWGHDVGGFFGPELTGELYVRWAQFGALSPLMRAHGLLPREPWAYGSRALEIVRGWIRLRYELLPYLWQVAQAARRGWPMLRHLWLEYPDDPVAATVDDAFLLGSDLLVVPIFDDGPGPVPRRFYVPPGHWTDLVTGTSYDGAGFAGEEVPLDRMPVLVRDGCLLPRVRVGADVRRTDDLVDRPWQVHVYGKGDVDLPLVGFDGMTSRVRVSGTAVTVDGTLPVDPAAVRH